MAWEEIIIKNDHAKHHGASSQEVMNRIAYSIHKSGGSSKCISFRIGATIIKECRWVKGDLIKVFADKETGYGLLKRVAADGWKLNYTNSRNIFRVSVNYVPGKVPYVKRLVVLNHVVTEEGIMFEWPKDESSTLTKPVR